jgi:pSer/pThr/pTyr-binding forkhead associated (FHA) protein
LREFKIFNLSGAKFGRAPENDFSYPDELSISGKHAQIFFKDESYYIRDLGSKTGTFVYISEKKPLVLSDEQVVQLSYEVELKVMIIKNVKILLSRISTKELSNSSSKSQKTSPPIEPFSRITTLCVLAKLRRVTFD